MEIEVIENENQLDLIEQKEKSISLQDQNNMLIQMAIEKDLDIEKLEKLIELKNQEEERQCKKEFDRHFTEMQKEFTPIDRSKAGYSSKYAPLDIMVKKFGPIISKHGFSYKWNEVVIAAGKRVTIIISGYGYTDSSTFFDVPNIEGTKQMNAIQVQGALSTYGERYTFKAGFGITETDEDVDANLTFEDGIEYANEIRLIRACQNIEQLKILWERFKTEMPTDKIGLQILAIEKNKKRKEFDA